MPHCVTSPLARSRTQMIRIGVLASGRGSNLQSLLEAEKAQTLAGEIVVLCSDRDDAPALSLARKEGKPAVFVDPRSRRARLRPETEAEFVSILREHEVEWVVLAGFLRIVGTPLLTAFPGRVLNIHPSLLPDFPGLHAQRQALEARATVSGCTVHLVESGVDTGPILAQRRVAIEPDDTETTLANRILHYEHEVLVETVRRISTVGFSLEDRRVRWHDDQ